MILEVSGLSKHFGGLVAVDNFDIAIEPGQIMGLIGPNGAGKTTIFNLIAGTIPPTTGKVVFEGQDITGKKQHEIAAIGISRTFQLTTLFADFTALENVVAACYLHSKTSFYDGLFNTSRYRRKEADALALSSEIIKLVGLHKVKDELAKNLPHGYQKMLGIARAMAVQPKLLLLDEPLGGMNPEEINFTMEIMQKLQKQGMTILVIEHNMIIMKLCDEITVINFGQKICEGCEADIRSNQDVIKAYLGEESAA